MLSAGIVALSLASAPPVDFTPARALRSFSRSRFRGLPQSTVSALAQDRSGLLWIGTLGGLGSYDGREIRTVSGEPPAPSFGAVTDLVARRGGGVFAGGRGGVHVYDGVEWRFFATSRATRSLAQGADGTLWMADVAGEVWTLEQTGSWRLRGEVGGDAQRLAGDGEGAVLIASASRGLLRVAGEAIEVLADGALPPGEVAALMGASDGRVWLATLDGGVYWTSRTAPAWRRVRLPEGEGRRFRCLGEDRRGRVWAAAIDGFVAFGRADGPWEAWSDQAGLAGGGIMAVLGDREGSVWFGINGVGLRQWLGEGWSHRRSFRRPGDTSRIPVFGVNRDASGRGVLAAVFTHGVLHYVDGRVRVWGEEEGLDENVRVAVEPVPGTLWVGGRFGIWESRGGARFRRTLEVPGGFVTGLFRSPQGEWWAATSELGVYRRLGGRWEPVTELNAALDDPHVRGLEWTSDGSLWVATPRGVDVFRNGEVSHLSAATLPELPESVNAVVEMRDGSLWAGGVGGIAVRRAGTWTRIAPADGLPGHTIYSLAEGPDGSVWAGGSSGVGRRRGGRWTVWDSSSGLIEEECNLNGLLVLDDGSVYAGTMASLAHLDPSVEAPPPPPLRLAWTERPPAGDGVARLPAGTPTLRLGWAAPWLLPSPVEFRTRVARLSPEWSAPSDADSIEIANPTAGRWLVEVAARVEGRAEWSAPLALSVVVAPHWYETAAARAGFAALAVLAVVGLVRLRTRQLRRRQRELQRAVDEALADVKVLSGLLPICASCKKVRDDRGYWSQIERYIAARSEAEFSHGICPDCLPRYFPPVGGDTGETP